MNISRQSSNVHIVPALQLDLINLAIQSTQFKCLIVDTPSSVDCGCKNDVAERTKRIAGSLALCNYVNSLNQIDHSLIIRRWCCGGNSSARIQQNPQQQNQSQQGTPSGRQVGDSNERSVSFQVSSIGIRNRAPSKQSNDEDAEMDETPLLCMSPLNLNHATTSALGGDNKEIIPRQDRWGQMLLRHHKLVKL